MRYSSPSKKILRVSSYFERKSLDDKDLFFGDLIAGYQDQGLDDDVAINKAQCDIVYLNLYSRRKWLTIYVESESLMDFLQNSKINDSDNEVIDSAVHWASENTEFIDGIMIHLPRRRDSILVAPVKSPDGDFVRSAIGVMCGENVGYYADSPYHDGAAKYIKSLEDDQHHWFIVCNLLMYMRAFPERIRNGVPALNTKASKPADYKRSFIIGASEQIKEVFERSKVTPHMRRGHFRLLIDERFTNKRGQTVYVKPSMIAGKAKTAFA